jgi:hypothetical protein
MAETEENEWIRKGPLTPDQLATFRKEQIERTRELIEVPEKFTCDDCGLAGVCKLAWDPFNIRGDCLYDK